MEQTEASAEFILDVEMSNSQPDELDHLTRQLRTELLERDVSSVDLLRNSEIPEGAKAAWATTAGTLVISLLPIAIPKFIRNAECVGSETRRP